MKKHFKRIVSILLSVIMVAGLFAIVPFEAGAAGNSWGSATYYNVGNQASGSITNTNTADYYKFTLSTSGKVNLSANSYMSYINYTIYDSNYNEVKYWYCYWNSTTGVGKTTENVDLVSGTY